MKLYKKYKEDLKAWNYWNEEKTIVLLFSPSLRNVNDEVESSDKKLTVHELNPYVCF